MTDLYDYHNGPNLGLEPTTPSPEPPAATKADDAQPGYAGVTVWVGDMKCTMAVPKQILKASRCDALLECFQKARHAIDAAQAQPKRRPYNASGSLSEYGISPECDAAPVAQDPAKGVDVALRYNWNEHLIEHNAPEYQHDFILFKVVEAYVLKHLADRQQRGGDALDAARYRWLRKNWQFSLHGQPVWVDIDPDLKPPIDSTTKLDELIDAAMSKEGKQ